MSSPHRHYALLAEDDYAFRWALAIELERNGFDLDVAENGAEALELMEKSGRHCCLIVDLKMPRMNGGDLIERARALRPTLPVVTVTAYPEELANVPPAHYSAVLHKPIGTDSVCRAAMSACQVKR